MPAVLQGCGLDEERWRGRDLRSHDAYSTLPAVPIIMARGPGAWIVHRCASTNSYVDIQYEIGMAIVGIFQGARKEQRSSYLLQAVLIASAKQKPKRHKCKTNPNPNPKKNLCGSKLLFCNFISRDNHLTFKVTQPKTEDDLSLLSQLIIINIH
eukprot:scaffold136494_cov47-Attheya_sp.AAC.2